MRFVIYDDETLQPVTVVNLPVDDEAIERMGRRFRVHAPTPMRAPIRQMGRRENVREVADIVEITFEKLRRAHRYNGTQETWMAFVSAIDLATRLKPDFLMGQERAVEYLQQQNDDLTAMLMRVMAGRGN